MTHGRTTAAKQMEDSVERLSPGEQAKVLLAQRGGATLAAKKDKAQRNHAAKVSELELKRGERQKKRHEQARLGKYINSPRVDQQFIFCVGNALITVT